MKILLLGKDGQVGWQLQRSLAPHGEVLAMGRPECDLSDFGRIRSLIRECKPGLIVNAAAISHVERAESMPEEAMRINGRLPGALADEAASMGALLIHFSDAQVFDGRKPVAYQESDACNPQNLYGETKLVGEQAILASDADAIIFRSNWVFGARGESFIKSVLRAARDHDSFSVPADQIGSPTPAALVSTVVGLVLAMLRHGRPEKTEKSRILHLAAARPISKVEFARTIVALACRMPGFELAATPERIHGVVSDDIVKAGRQPQNAVLDCRRLEQSFQLVMPDWQPYLERMLQLLSLKRNGY